MFCFLGLSLLISSCTSIAFFNSSIKQSEQIGYSNYSEIGLASFYGEEFSGRKTASGELFNPNDYTAAHRILPFGTKVKVVNLENGKEIIVRINDRGPFVEGRIIDLSKASARALGFLNKGIARVKIEVVE
ncbi:MAG: septal ring lytic transglycosylase RlpA family protein [Ignavibacteria bacterium]|nr:septal ring lytic transglycosylase RlpA family protein [Ignavibacteria bacterium]